MAARDAVSRFPNPGQESEVMNAWDRLVCGAELPANAVRITAGREEVRDA